MKCVVGLSGGVDSSTSAALMKSKGYEVVGCTFKMFEAKKCEDAIANARQVADFLNIEHEVINCAADFRKYVTNYFVDSYYHGLTPNPCVMCNCWIKFRYLEEFRRRQNADFLATGHYARLRVDNGSVILSQAADARKDQSYFLYAVDREILSHAIFPLSEYTKTETRAMARKFGLHVSESSESQDICFVQDNNYVSFIKKYRNNVCNNDNACDNACDNVCGSACAADASDAGDIVDKSGKVLGKHNGMFNYTIGQRKGLGLSGGPFFVCGLDCKRNEVIVAGKDDVRAKTIVLKNVVFINREFLGDCLVQIRSTNAKIKASLERNAENHDSYFVKLYESEYGVAKGQHCVFYGDNNVVLGGGMIA